MKHTLTLLTVLRLSGSAFGVVYGLLTYEITH